MLERVRIPEKDVLKKLLDQIQEAESREAAFQAFCTAMADIGFNGAMFATQASGAGWQEDISETSYPDAWVRHYVASGYERTDPSRRFGFRHAKPFFWSDLTPILHKKDRRVFQEAREFGLITGLGMPIFSFGTLIGGVGLSSETAIHDPRLKSTVAIAAQIFCTVYNQIVAEEKAPHLSADDLPAELTKRETEVLAILVTGANNSQIADALHVSQSAVEYHVKNIFRKFGVESRVAAAVKAVRLGLINPG